MRGANGAAAIVVTALLAFWVGVGAQGADLKTAAAAILKADRDFNQSVTDRDPNRFVAFLAETAIFNGGLSDEIHGRDAIAKDWAPYFRADGPRLTWNPTKAEGIGHGNLGYSVGTYESRTVSADGKTTVSRGNYMTMWRKEADGSWKVVFDTGSSF